MRRFEQHHHHASSSLFPPSTENFLRHSFFLSSYAYFSYRVVFQTLHSSRTLLNANRANDIFRGSALLLHSILETCAFALMVLPFWRKLFDRAMFLPMSSGSFFLRRFSMKTTLSGGRGRRRRKSAFVVVAGERELFEKDSKNFTTTTTGTMKSIESNVSKLERMTPVFSRELMAFVSGNKSELYEKTSIRKTNAPPGAGKKEALVVVAERRKRGNGEDFRQPTSQFLSIFSVGSKSSGGSESSVLSLTDESCIRPSELAKKHFPAIMNAVREVNGMNVRVVALRPSYRYEEKKKIEKKKKKKKKNAAKNNSEENEDGRRNAENNNTRRNYYLEEIIAKSNRLNRRLKPKRFPISDCLYTVYACLAKDSDCEVSDVGVEAEFLGHPVQKMPLEVGDIVCVDPLARSRMFNAGEAVLEYNEDDEEEEEEEEQDEDNEEHRLLQKNIFAKAGKGCVVLVFDMLHPKYERNGTAKGIAKCVEEMTRVFGDEKSSAFEKLAVSIKCNLS